MSNKYVIKQSTLQDIANAIRQVTGSSDLLKVSDFKTEILKLRLPDQTLVNIINSTLFTDGWKFSLLGTGYIAQDASIAAASYNDSSWSTVNLPHDWSIYNDFSSSSAAGYEGGYLNGGTAWYRKEFTLSELPENKKLLYFDGVYMESAVYVNGTKVKEHNFGYSPFTVDITDYLTVGTNVIAVYVLNRQPSSRWYSGSGIYRNVYMLDASVDDVAFDTVKIDTDTTGKTDLNITVENNTTESVSATIKTIISQEWDGTQVAEKTSEVTLAAGSNTIPVTVTVSNPVLWNTWDKVDNVRLYTAKVIMTIDNIAYYYTMENFGYRTYEYKADGIYVNGEKLFLKGVCMHHDLGCLGAEINVSAIERQLKTLQEMGCNAIRLTHNPFAKEYLDLCQRMGMITIEEFFDTWKASKKTYDYGRYLNTDDEYAKSVIKETIDRDYNNPSIVMWSIGNEIVRTNKTKMGADALVAYCQDLYDWIKENDTVRGVTMGDDTPTDTTTHSCMAILDVIGVNYGSDSEYSTVRNKFPEKCTYGSETTSMFSARGKYIDDTTNMISQSYEKRGTYSCTGWGDPTPVALNRHMNKYGSWMGGIFHWTGFDYIGEPTPWNKYPSVRSDFGMIDTCGFRKDAFYVNQAAWTTTPMVHILPMDWTVWTVDDSVDVHIYSNCPKVELFLNGESLGVKDAKDSTYFAYVYAVTFKKGTLVANGLDASGNVVAQDIIYTHHNSVKMNISADKTTVNKNGSLVFVTVDVCDENDVICLGDDTTSVTFSVTGGSVVGTDNGHVANVENLRGATHKVFSGKVLGVIKPDKNSNKLVITATSSLGSASCEVNIGTSDVLKTISTPTIKNISDIPVYETEEVVLTNITATKTTTSYTTADTFSSNDITVTAHYSDGSSAEITDFTVDSSAVQIGTPGTYLVNIAYEGKTTTISISVTQAVDPSDTISCTGIEVAIDEAIGTSDYITTGTNRQFTVTLTPSNTTDQLTASADGCDVTIDGNKVNVKYTGTGASTIPVTFGCGSQTTSYTLNVLKVTGSGGTLSTQPSETASVNSSITLNLSNISQSTSGNCLYIFNNDDVVISTKATDWTVVGTKPLAVISSTNSASSNTSGTGYIKYTEAGKKTISMKNNTIEKQIVIMAGTKEATSLTLSEHGLTASDSVSLVATVLPEDTTQSVVWTSSDESIATVTGGAVLPLGNGDVIITATAGSATDSCSITFENIVVDETLKAKDIIVDGSTKATYYEGEADLSSNALYIELTTDQIASASNAAVFDLGKTTTAATAWKLVGTHAYYPYKGSATQIQGCVGTTASSNPTQAAYNITNSNNLLRFVIGTDASGNIGWYCNGSQLGAITSTLLNNLGTTISVGSYEGSTRYVGTVKEVRIIPSTEVTSFADLTTNGYVKA